MGALRSKQVGLCIPVQTVESHGDDYYYSLLLQYILWRKEPEDLLLNHYLAMEAFIAREGEMVVHNAENHTFTVEVQRAVKQLQALKDNAYQDAVAPMTLQVQREDASKPPVEAEVGLMNPENFADPHYFQDDTEGAGNVDEGIINDDNNAIGVMIRSTLPDEVFQQLVANLNTQQLVPFDIVVQYTQKLHKYKILIIIILMRESSQRCLW